MSLGDLSLKQLAEWRDEAVSVARQAGLLIKQASYQVKSIETKAGVVDLVTSTDREVEQLICGSLRSKFPDHRCSI